MPQCPAKRISDGEISYCTLEQGHLGYHVLGKVPADAMQTYRQRAAARLRQLADEIEKGEL